MEHGKDLDGSDRRCNRGDRADLQGRGLKRGYKEEIGKMREVDEKRRK